MGYEHKGTQTMKVAVREGPKMEFDEFPGLKQEELDAVNDFYDHYLFYEKFKKGRKFWSSCCHEEGRYMDLTTQRTFNNQTLDVLYGPHDIETTCPFCGKAVRLKAKGTSGKCKNLESYIPVIFLSTADNGETIYAQAYWTNKDYDHNWAAEPLYKVTCVYRFRRGEAVQWCRDYWDRCWYKKINGFFSEPFRDGGGLFFKYCDYQVIGLECLKDSFLKYIDFAGCRHSQSTGCWNVMRLLGLAAQYPENVEMLQKAGMSEVLDDWTRREVKNARNIHWGETDPQKAFQLNKKELKAFLATKRELSVMTLYKQAKRKKAPLSMAECQEIRDACGWSVERELPKLLKQHDTSMKDLYRYLKRQAGAERNLGTAFQVWKDYLAVAEALELRIYRSDIKFPKDLWAAHDTAAEQNRRRLEKERRRQQRMAIKESEEKDRFTKLAYAERKKALELRYGYAADGLQIRVPESREEIVAEGMALQHCVGGYADRHLEGAVTILFLRKESAPTAPFLTVEMNGSHFVQIHGYKNEGLYTTKGRFAPDPKEVYKSFLDPWLAWVERGSPRNKKGEPVKPRPQRMKVEVQIA